MVIGRRIILIISFITIPVFAVQDGISLHYGVGIGLLEAMSAGLPIASSFAHRTSTPFLFLGVILVVFKHKMLI